LPPGEFGIEAGTLFLIQFFWQFRAIGWFCMTIMRRLVSLCLQAKKDKGTALQIILYTVWLILASLLPVFWLHGAFIYYASSGSSCFLLGLCFFTQ
jgi:protoheme IX farnesyltransferase